MRHALLGRLGGHAQLLLDLLEGAGDVRDPDVIAAIAEQVEAVNETFAELEDHVGAMRVRSVRRRRALMRVVRSAKG